MKKLLIVDVADEEISAIEQYLKDCGYDVVATDNALGASALLKENKFDLILCAQSMFLGGASPLDTIILEADRHSRIILLQEILEESAVISTNERIIGTIKKPINREKLLEVISGEAQKSGLTGLMNDIDLTDYIQLLAMNNATKAFAVEGNEGSGIMVLYEGDLIYAAYGDLRGDLAFHALLAIKNGKFTDKKLKKVPPTNISKSLGKLLLEASQEQDESISEHSSGTQNDDFLVEEPEPFALHQQETSTVTTEPKKKKSRMPAIAGFLLFACLASAAGYFAWQNYMQPQARAPLASIAPQPPFSAEVQPSSGDDDSSMVKDSASADTQALASTVSATAQEKTDLSGSEAKAMPRMVLPPAPILSTGPPKIILRLHGSNTIGSKLAGNLARDYLTTVMHAKRIKEIQGKTGVEKVVAGITEKGYLGIEIFAHGSSTGFKDLKANLCDVGMASRKIKEKEVKLLSNTGDMTSPAAEHVLGLDGIAVIVNKKNPIKSMSISQIADIFTGKVKDWSEIEGSTYKGPIQVYARDNKSGTYDTFKSIVLKKTPLVSTAQRFESNPVLSDEVAKDSNGIGFTGLPYIRQSKAIAVSDQGTLSILPSFFTVATEDYPLARRLYFYLPENSQNTVAAGFIDFALGTRGQEVVADAGFIDLAIRPFAANIPLESLEVHDSEVFQRYLLEIDKKKRLSLNFRFNPNSTELDNRSRRDLNRIIEFLQDNPSESISLIGFADSRGAYEFNKKLAFSRAKAVADELRSRGIPIASVISASEELPIASNLSDHGREKNRRVEVWIGKTKG